MDAISYQEEATRTVRINWENPHGPDIAILGAIGELGSIASVLKKQQRDQKAYADFELHLKEEIGDILWYVTTIASRLNIPILAWPAVDIKENINRFDVVYSLMEQIQHLKNQKELLISRLNSAREFEHVITNILTDLQKLSISVNTKLERVAFENITKTLGYWGEVSMPAHEFDKGYPFYEKLPRQFEIEFLTVESGKSSIMRMNGLQLGDRLTDNSYYNDGYRFHDIFHIAGAGLLGWSPVFRRLLKAKRKSNPQVDEVEDGARAAIVEEAVINYIYDYAQPHFLKDVKWVDIGVIKQIIRLVRGLEVKDCEPWEWRHCILESYRIFRELTERNEGILKVNAQDRTLTLLPLEANRLNL
jgi:NTP pyrophosphatase (non-canonical NTP hydrolase)